jgi:erythromycin esterase
MGFTAIALETGVAEAGSVQAFVSGGAGEVDQVVRDGFTYGFGTYEENRALVRWIRNYNADVAHTRKVRFYGIDISLGGPRTATPTPLALETTLDYVARINASEAIRIRRVTQPLRRRLGVENPESFP